MELIKRIHTYFFSKILMLLLGCLFTQQGYAQNKCMIKNGGMYIVINRHQPLAALDSFLTRYDLNDLDVKTYYRPEVIDSLKLKGWTIEGITANEITFSKTLLAPEKIYEPQNAILIGNKNNSDVNFDQLKEAANFGYNHFVNKPDFIVKNGMVTFYLRGHAKAHKVLLSGTFNNWSTSGIAMTKCDSGWTANVQLTSGKYWYKFIVDNNWMTDNDNLIREKNEYSEYNSIYYCCNYTFNLNDFNNAKRVYLTGNFVNWDKNKLLMHKTPKGWELPVYMNTGTYTYKFLVDDKWTHDPLNPNKVSDENGGFNSVLIRGPSYTFKLKGFADAKQVYLTGTFNNWKEGELLMQKTKEGCQLTYAMRAGNYEYKFIVDGQWITDPNNKIITRNERQTFNSVISIQPNYTFRLKANASAKSVAVSGDFNGWNDYGYAMTFVDGEWVLPVYLRNGKHTYKFIVDGNWILDPANKLWENNEYNSGNSVLWINQK